MKVVFAMDGARCRIPGQSGHRKHDGFLNPPRPSEMPVQYCCDHDAKQVKEIARTLDLKRMACLYDFGKRAMGFDFFPCEDELVINIEQYKQTAYDQCPLRKQTQRKLKRYAPEESEEQRRITEGRQQARRVAHNEYEKNDQMSPVPPQMIRAQERPNQQHGCAGRSNQI